MLDHFEIRTINFEQCKRFYALVLRPLNIELKWSDNNAAGFGERDEKKVRFMIHKSDLSCASHIAFSASDKNAVNCFHQVAIENGYKSNGEPGTRQAYAPNYYAAFILDPDGNNVEAVVYL